MESEFRRFLYLCDSDSFTAGNPENYSLKNHVLLFEKLESFLSADENNFESIIELIVRASSNEFLPRNISLFYGFAFVILARKKLEKYDVKLKKTLINNSVLFIRNDEELFKFISIFTRINNKKISPILCDIFIKFIEKNSSIELANKVGKFKGFHGWTYKDLIKLSHYQSKKIENAALASYILFGAKKLEECPENVQEILKNWEQLKKSDDENLVTKLVQEFKVDCDDFIKINPKLIKSQKVWESILTRANPREILKILLKLFKLGVLKSKSVQNKIIEALTLFEKISEFKLSPLEVFIHKKTFENGGKPLDFKLVKYLKEKMEDKLNEKYEIKPPNCPNISAAIGKCLKLSYNSEVNPKIRLNKRILIILNSATEPDSACFKAKNISTVEAQLNLTYYYAKTEEKVHAIISNNEKITRFDTTGNYIKNLGKLREQKSDYLNLRNVFKWAARRKEKFDLFLCILHKSDVFFKLPKEERANLKIPELLTEYQEKTSNFNMKLVTICLGSNNLAVIYKNCLTINGFCEEIPKIIKAFVDNEF